MNNKRVFIVGAGFSHQLSNRKCPLTKQLGKDFVESSFFKDNQILEKYFKDSVEGHTDCDIEKIITQIDLDLNAFDVDSSLKIAKECILEFIKDRLEIKRINKSLITPFNSFKYCKNLFKRDDVIITFNYDCLLEHTLWQLRDKGHQWWHYNGGYGRSIDDRIHGPKGGSDSNYMEIRILKMHGSLNFKFLEMISNRDSPDVMCQSTPDIFPNDDAPETDWINETWEGLILPSYLKPFGDSFAYINLFYEAVDAIKNADVINIIGYSLPKSDVMAHIMLSYIGYYGWPNPEKSIVEERNNKGIPRINILSGKDDIKKIKFYFNKLPGFSDKMINKEIVYSENNAYQKLLDENCLLL